MMKIDVALANESETERFGKRLAELLPPCVVELNGTLGAGKTRLVRAIATALGADAKDVTSPTFTLWQTYAVSKTIHHLDAYRVKDEDEFDQLGVDEVFESDAIVFIEWAQRVDACLPKTNRLAIQLEVISDEARQVTLTTDDEQLANAISSLTDF